MATVEDTKTRLQNIDPYEFEQFVADLWEAQGWETEVSQASNDMGVDVIARKADGMVEQKLAIQAKRYSAGNKIGRQDVQQYYSMKVQDAQADAAVIVTTSSFTKPAEDWASEHNVKLIDGDDIIQLLNEKSAGHILDEYAPTLGEAELDPAHTSEQPKKTDELGVEVEGEDAVKLPEQLQDDDTRAKIGAGAGLVGIYLILNPSGISLPVEALGMLVLLAGVAVYQFPVQVWDAVTPTREVYRELGHGGVVALDGDSIQYEPPGEDEPILFDNSDEQRARQRAVVYGALDKYVGGNLPETQKGTLPTMIANEGAQTIAAYRFAVHNEAPSKIASEMGMTQQDVVDHLTAIVN